MRGNELREIRQDMDRVIDELKATIQSTKEDAIAAAAQESSAQFDQFKSDLVAAAASSFRAELEARLEALATDILSKVKSCKCTSKDSA